MVSSSAQPASRYRRRILGLGALATGTLYVVGAPIFNDHIESDLESRVPIELAALGFEGLTAEFSGQDGTLFCERPVRNPDGALTAAFDIRGVRTVDFDPESPCRALIGDAPADSSGSVDPTDDVSDDDVSDDDVSDDDEEGETTAETSAEASDVASDDGADATTEFAPTTEVTTPTTDADLASIAEVIAADPDLSFLSLLLADVVASSVDQPVTLFAPSNQAFESLPVDVTTRLQNDAEFRQAFVDHHTVAGTVMSTDLVAGTLQARDGSELTVTTGDVNTVDGSALVDVDIAASNGVVHVVDRVLPFDALDLQGDVEVGAANLAGSTMTLSGLIASEVERNVLATAAVDVAGVENVVDETSVDPDRGLDADTSNRLAVMIAAMPANLISGEAGFDGTALYARGVYRSEQGRDAFAAAAASVDVEATLEPPPEASETDAVDLEAQLNAFVAENPIVFQPASAVLDESAFAVIDRIATDVQGFTGVAIAVEGHTDSDGSPDVNLRLSQNRADAVRTALIERGVATESVDAIGFGSEQPIVVDDVEVKGASRRVEFRVVATS